MKPYKLLKLLGLSLFLVLVFIRCDKEEDFDKPNPIIQNIIEEVNADSLEKTVIWLQNIPTRFMLANNRKEVASKIQKKFINLGIADTKLDSFTNSRTFNGILYETWQYNVVATMQGNTNPNQYNVLGAHYDCYTRDVDMFTTTYGANDNASGVAALLEIARLFKKNNVVPKNTIQFVAFAAEELGLYGSWDFAAKSSANRHNITMMLNFDMIAHWPDNDQSNWTINIVDYQNSHSLRKKAENICYQYTVLKTTNDNTYYNRSDSYLFFQYGYPAIFFESPYPDDTYHTSADIYSNCNFIYCREVVMASTALIIEENL